MTTTDVLSAAAEISRALDQRGLVGEARTEALVLAMGDEPASLPEPVGGAGPAAPAVRQRADQAAQTEARAAEMLALVTRVGGRAEVSWLAERMNVSAVTARKYADLLIERGALVAAARGLVAIPGKTVRPAGTTRNTIIPSVLDALHVYLSKNGPKSERDIAARFGATRVDELVRQGRARVEGDLVHAVEVTRG